MIVQINLPEDLESFVQRKLRTGAYRSVVDIVIEALEAQRAADETSDQSRTEMKTDLDAAWDELRQRKKLDGPARWMQSAASLSNALDREIRAHRNRDQAN